jgi:Transglycosylase SLT domain
MTARGKAHTSKRRRSAPRARPRMTSATATSSSGAAEKSSLKTRIGHDWNTLFRRLRRWRKRAHMALCKLNAVPPAVRTVAIAAVALGVFSVTFVYHVVRKPTEMFFPVSGALNKMPAETWRQYAPLFNEYSTATITPELLAALAQVESAGNPVARYWRWRLTWHPFELYQPASSAVGMYQLTDAACRRTAVLHPPPHRR